MLQAATNDRQELTNETEAVCHWNHKLAWEESRRKSVFELPLLSLKGELPGVWINDGLKQEILK